MKSLKRLVTLVMCCVKLTISTSNEPCLTTYQISEWKRSVAYTDTNGMCDSFLYEGWYRVTSGAGEMMPTECPKWGFRCGTVNPLYLSREGINDTNEQLFPIGGETVERVACMADMHGNCCKDRIHIKIRNCGMYFVYYLKATTSCPSAYCFGENLPCPEGESSENGFSPGCGTYPNVTVPSPLVTTGLYEETYPNQDHNNAMYSYHTVQFQCNTNLVSKYTYDVRWYIDDFEITEAAHTNVSDKNLAFTTMLKQHHWEYMFKPNMMVQCSIQVREVSLSSPGLKSYSEKFFAGIIVDQNHFEIKEGEETTINISVTIPIGCSYPTESPK